MSTLQFYEECKLIANSDITKIIDDLKQKFNECKFIYTVSYGLIIACGINHRDPRTAQYIAKTLKTEKKCLHSRFQEAVVIVRMYESNNKINSPIPQYTLSSRCLLEPYVDLLNETIKEKIDIRCRKFLELSCDVIFRIPESWSLIEIYYMHVKSYGSNTNHLYKVPKKNLATWSHVLRIPFATRLKAIVEIYKFDKLKIVEESLICLKSLEDIQELSEKQEQITQFIVKSKIESIMNEAESAVFLANQSIEDKLEFAHQLIQLSCLSGLTDIHLQNMRIDRKTCKLIILDTKPTNGAMFLSSEEIKEISLKDMLNNIIMPECLPIFNEVVNSYIRNL